MLILGLLGMYFDAAVVFVTSQTLLLRLALAILCKQAPKKSQQFFFVAHCYVRRVLGFPSWLPRDLTTKT